jgi:hypothetical protein
MKLLDIQVIIGLCTIDTIQMEVLVQNFRFGWVTQFQVMLHFNSSTTVSNNNWYHLAVTRSSNTIRLFVNGTVEASNTVTSASMDSLVAKPICLGRTGYGDSGANAFIDDLRITKGIARYTSNFTPPGVPPKK